MHSDEQWPDVQFGVGPFSMLSSAENQDRSGTRHSERAVRYHVERLLSAGESRGSIAIQSADIGQAVLVDANWWEDPEERKLFVDMLRLIRSLAAQPALAPFIVHEVVPWPQYQSDEEIADALQMACPSREFCECHYGA
jgi:choline dehydrogenase